VTIVAASPESVDVEVEVGSGGVDRTTASNDMEFRISSEGKGTRVTWMMTGDGGLDVADLEQGLARLKALSEARER
jgi:carbon monoxide dehydrogenase subunit G